MGKNQVSTTDGAREADSHLQKKKWSWILKLCSKINSKYIKDLNIRPKITKAMEESMKKIHDSEFGNDFFDVTLKAQQTEENIDKWDYIKLKNFCASKKISNRVKKQLTEWEETFVSHISDTMLISRIHKELL